MRTRVTTVLTIIGVAFTVLGAAAVIVAAVTAIGTLQFRSGAEQASGKVVAVDSHISCHTEERNGHRRRDCDRVYTPTVEFNTADGKKITFRPNYSTGDAPQVGDSVDVLYPPDDPQAARLAGVTMWLVPLITGIIGLPFLVVGLVFLGLQLKRRRLNSWLDSSGRRVQGQILGVDRNRSVRINRVHPWRIHAGWQDPATGTRHEFTSENLMNDPTPALAGAQSVDVLIDPANPERRYRIDLTPYGL